MSFINIDYKPASATAGRYTKFKQGSTRLRLFGDIDTGSCMWIWEAWKPKDGKDMPCRFPLSEKPTDLTQFRDGKIKECLVGLAWNHDANIIQICSIPQNSIKLDLRNLLQDEDWGDLKDYDVVIRREGEQLGTTYKVIPKSKAPLEDSVIEVIRRELPKIRLDALFTNEDPFEGLTKSTITDDDVPY